MGLWLTKSLLRMTLAGPGPVYFPSVPLPIAHANPGYATSTFIAWSVLTCIRFQHMPVSALPWSLFVYFTFFCILLCVGAGECEYHTACVGVIGQLRTTGSLLAGRGTELRSAVSDSKFLYPLSLLENPPWAFSTPAPFAGPT